MEGLQGEATAVLEKGADVLQPSQGNGSLLSYENVLCVFACACARAHVCSCTPVLCMCACVCLCVYVCVVCV
jgi:hypothetical protein